VREQHDPMRAGWDVEGAFQHHEAGGHMNQALAVVRFHRFVHRWISFYLVLGTLWSFCGIARCRTVIAPPISALSGRHAAGGFRLCISF
jgi:hypothetical protein